MLKRTVKSACAKLMGWRPLSDRAWKLAYWGKFSEWLARHPCREFRGSYQQARRELYRHVQQTVALDGPINYLEFGVYQGDSLRWWVEHNQQPGSRFVGFDSFEGLPEDWRTDRPKGYFNTEGKAPEIGDPRCTFRVGWFHDTLPGFVCEFPFDGRLVVHLDADLYSSTLFVLTTLAPRLKEQDVLFFDEFENALHEFRAFTDFVSAYGFDYEVLAMTHGGTQVAVRLLGNGLK